MNRFALLGFYRSLARHRLYAAINIGGLAAGLAVFLVLTIYVRFENSYETWLPGWRDVYQIMATGSARPLDNNTPIALWTAVARDLPETVGTRVRDESGTVVKDGVGVSEDLALVDTAFPKVFQLPVVAGDFAHAFADPSNIVLTEGTARKYFPGGNALGRTMTVVLGGKPRLYRVAAIVADRPPNTDMQYDMLARLVVTEDKTSPDYVSQHEWNYFDPQTFVRLASGDAVRRFTADVAEVSRRHATSETPSDPGTKLRTALERMADVHFEEPGKRLAVATLGIVGALTLLIAIVNYVNLATARAGLRAREVAMRKVLGADRTTLVRHYLAEAVATTMLAAFIGLVLAEVAMPVLNAAVDLSISIHYFGRQGVVLPLAALVLLIGVVAGLYPTVVLSRFPAAAVLASARSPGGGRAGARVREGLVVAQFAIAIAFVIGTFVLTAQTAYVRNADVGYQREGLMLIPSLGSSTLGDGQRDTLMHRFAQMPGIVAATVANNMPGPSPFKSTSSIAIPGDPGPAPDLRFFQTTPGFFRTMGAHLIAGRLFDASRQADVNPNYDPVANNSVNGPLRPYNIVVNRAALQILRIPSPQAAIGRTFVTPNAPTRTIVGVIDDMRFDDPRSPIPPSFYEFVTKPPSSAIGILRFTGDPKALRAAAQAVWRQEAAEVPFDAKTAAQNLEKFYRSDDRSANLFTIGAVLAVAIGCVGLWGLASFNTARRTKEIGIRKTLGASSADIVRLLLGQFLRPVLIANLFAWPLAWFAMRTWLQGFDDRIALSPLYFVAATLLALVIAVLTVFAQSLRAARAAPSWALRHE